MDLAIKFNDIGCAYYQEGRTEHAYDLFCGAMQALHHSVHTGCMLDEMDGIGRQVRSITQGYMRVPYGPLTQHYLSLDVACGPKHPASL